MQINQGYLLGVDTGNTKTHALISDLSGKVFGFGETGCGNYESIGLEGLKAVINHATISALKMAGIEKTAIKAMGFGLAGYDWPSEKPIMVQAIESLGINAPFKYVNDTMIGLLAGAHDGWGIAVDAGTGNNVRGRDQSGRMGRITGNSAPFGEYGGGSELVARAVIEVTYAWTKRQGCTRLTKMLMDYAGVDSEAALIESLALSRAYPPAALAQEVFNLAAEGDSAARKVINWTARELGLNTNAVIRQLDFQELEFDVVLIGSIWKAGDAYLQPFTQTVHEFAPGANLVQLSAPPVVGSIMLAAETLSKPSQSFRRSLICTTQSLLSSIPAVASDKKNKKRTIVGIQD